MIFHRRSMEEALRLVDFDVAPARKTSAPEDVLVLCRNNKPKKTEIRLSWALRAVNGIDQFAGYRRKGEGGGQSGPTGLRLWVALSSHVKLASKFRCGHRILGSGQLSPWRKKNACSDDTQCSMVGMRLWPGENYMWSTPCAPYNNDTKVISTRPSVSNVTFLLTN